MSPRYTYRNCPLVSGEADSENVWSIWSLAGQIFLHYLQKNDFSFLVLQVDFSSPPKFKLLYSAKISLKERQKHSWDCVINPRSFCWSVPSRDIFLFPLQNHPGHGNKRSLHSATELVPMKPWVWGAGVLVLYFYSQLWVWILQDLAVDPGWRKHDSRTRFCCCHNLKGQENKSKQEPRLALKCWVGILEGKERMRWLDCLNSCSESAALFACPSLTAQQPPPCQVKQSNPKKCNLPQCSRITLRDRTSPQTREKGKRYFQMRYEADVIVDFLTGTAKNICTSSKGEQKKKMRVKYRKGKGPNLALL